MEQHMLMDGYQFHHTLRLGQREEEEAERSGRRATESGSVERGVRRDERNIKWEVSAALRTDEWRDGRRKGLSEVKLKINEERKICFSFKPMHRVFGEAVTQQ